MTHASSQREYALKPENRSYKARKKTLEILIKGIEDHQDKLIDALQEDLKKPPLESYGSELGPALMELRHARKHLKRWMKWKRPGRRRRIIPEPFGSALIIGTWNYPVNLTLSPLAAALAAGNAVTIKPSEHAPATAEALESLMHSLFPEEHVRVVQGDAETVTSLIDEGFDKVFFTGSPGVGRLVAERAVRHHSHVTLELGGKSPAVIGADSDLEYALKRILWGKFLNAGQTCVAPDYLLIPEGWQDKVMPLARTIIEEFMGEDGSDNTGYTRIINQRHFDRLRALLDKTDLSYESDKSALYIKPLVIPSTVDGPLMQEEIFGPILPVLTYKNFEDLKNLVSRHRNPLALYVFTKNRAFEKRVLHEIEFGGAMVNDVIMHLTDHKLPFGGKGRSGMGAYHGRFGFDAFSHYKAVLTTRQGITGSLRFPPYRDVPAFLRKLLFGM